MSPRKVLFVMEGGGTLTQDYVRGVIYRDLFSSAGITARYVGHHSAPPDWLLRPISKNAKRIVKTYEYQLFAMMLDRIRTRLNRRQIVRLAKHYDAVMFVKVSSLDLIKQVRCHTKARLVYDMSDAVWLPFHGGIYPDIRDILSAVDAVTWDYQYTLEFARQYNNALFHWPAASQVEFFDVKRVGAKLSKRDGKTILGWVGSPGTALNLYVIWEALEKLFQRIPSLHLRLLGVGNDPLLLPHFEGVSYSVLPYYGPQQMIDEIFGMDIGLFPLFDVQDSCIRGFLKALVYMSGEAAVIASPRGQIPELIQDGVNGMLANSTQEWVDKLERLITDHELRRRIAAAGLETVRRDYSLDKSFEALLRALGMS